MSAPGKYIGTVPCTTQGCSSLVSVKLNKGGRAYGRCDRCTRGFDFAGLAHSQRFVREEVTMQSDPYDLENPGNPGDSKQPVAAKPADDSKGKTEKPKRGGLLAGTPFAGL
ncbi:hypothetical protein [Burkholderia savannae]|uniref:hypothetical protein n=1 Tax=Burkholderia savannae TaxID=1637837 RepID=UPI000B311835|nr:hypothetical protein [Burkholderia savannae]